MDNKEYWNERAEQKVLMTDKRAGELLETMKPVYKNSLADIDKEIQAFYGRYATNNNLTLEEVHKRLNPSELKSAKEEMARYYNLIDKLAKDKTGKVDVELLKRYKDEIRLQSAKSYMSRLEELKMSLKNITINLGVKESEAYYQTLSRIYTDSYEQTSYDIDKFKGFNSGFTELNEVKLNSAIHEQWLGMNFSDRIWNNKGKLLNQLNTTFLQGVAQGHNPKKIAKEMAKNYGTAYYNCERLARTECANIMEQATLKSYDDNDVEQYEFLATLDDRTCDEHCGELDGKRFRLKDAEVGINYPPMHPNCRCTTVPYFDELEKDSYRVAKNENGETYEVPETMTFREWKEKFVDND